MQQGLDSATAPWGVLVERVEVGLFMFIVFWGILVERVEAGDKW